MKKLTLIMFAILAMVAFAATAYAQKTLSSTFDVTTDVGNYCDAPVGSGVTLDQYDPLANGITAVGTGSVSVTCVNGIPVEVQLNAGANKAAAVLAGFCTGAAQRAMKDNSGNFLCYEVNYTGSSGNDAPAKANPSTWGSSDADPLGTSVDGTGAGGSVTYGLTAWATPRQTEVPVGPLYSDTIQITINY